MRVCVIVVRMAAMSVSVVMRTLWSGTAWSRRAARYFRSTAGRLRLTACRSWLHAPHDWLRAAGVNRLRTTRMNGLRTAHVDWLWAVMLHNRSLDAIWRRRLTANDWPVWHVDLRHRPAVLRSWRATLVVIGKRGRSCSHKTRSNSGKNLHTAIPHNRL